MFTREDLITGVFVKLKDGDLGVVVGNRIVLQKGTYMDIFDYKDDLCCPSNRFCDIMEVRDGGMNSHLNCFNNFNRMALIYERNLFTLDKIKDGDIVTVTRKDTPPFDFYKCGDLLLPIDSIIGAYNLGDFDEQTLCFTVNPNSNANIKISRVLKPCCEADYALHQRNMLKVVYEREE